MNTSQPISLNEHLQYCHNIAQSPARLCTLSSFDGHPASVAPAKAQADWKSIPDFGSYAVGTLHPKISSRKSDRTPVYAIDRVIVAHLAFSRGVQSIHYYIKLSKLISIYTNLHKMQSYIEGIDSQYLYTRLNFTAPSWVYLQKIYTFCTKYQCSLEFAL